MNNATEFPGLVLSHVPLSHVHEQRLDARQLYFGITRTHACATSRTRHGSAESRWQILETTKSNPETDPNYRMQGLYRLNDRADKRSIRLRGLTRRYFPRRERGPIMKHEKGSH